MFLDDDLQKIREAVSAAEQRTRGEIVPMIVPASARYVETRYLAGLGLALISLTLLVTWEAGWGQHLWHLHDPAWIVLAVVLAYALGYGAALLPAVVRVLTPRERLTFKVRRRAELAFYEHGLHKTREGTGVLIMASLLERRVQILADKAINERVPAGTWDAIVAELTRDIKEGRPTEGFCRAIARCGDLLAEHFPARPGDNPDELPDDLIREK